VIGAIDGFEQVGVVDPLPIVVGKRRAIVGMVDDVIGAKVAIVDVIGATTFGAPDWIWFSSKTMVVSDKNPLGFSPNLSMRGVG